MIEQKRKALADILNTDESQIAFGTFGFEFDQYTYEVLCEENEIKEALDSELDYERQCAIDSLYEADLEWLITYVDFDKYYADAAFNLEDFGFAKHIINGIIYYVRIV